MPRLMHHDRASRLFAKSLQHGAQRTGLLSSRWDMSGDCRNTYWMAYIGRPGRAADGSGVDGDGMFTFVGGRSTIHVDIGTRCRRCDKCLRHRKLRWRYRIREEVRRAARNWWGTLTLAPANHYRVMVEARRKAENSSVTWETLSDEERFKRISDTSLKEVTKYLKRVRKASGHPLRYVLVTERHKSGLPHFHLILHEQELRPIPHRILSGQWNGKNFALGFEKWRLIPFDDEERHVGYVSKYISKGLSAKVRASQRYGEPLEQATVGALVRDFKDRLDGSPEGA